MTTSAVSPRSWLPPAVGATLLAAGLGSTGCTVVFIDVEASADAGAQPDPDGAPRPDARPPPDGAPATPDAAPACGDGHVDPGEDCDQGAPDCDAACRWIVRPQVPRLTGPQSGLGVVVASGEIGPDYAPWHAFDQNGPTMWISQDFVTPAWVGFQWNDGPRRIERYALRYENGSITSRAPRDFALHGWTGDQWIEVDRRSGEVDWLGSERREYEVAAPGRFAGYRLYVTDDNDPDAGVVVISLGELELIGTP
jgi:hypothetical protein